MSFMSATIQCWRHGTKLVAKAAYLEGNEELVISVQTCPNCKEEAKADSLLEYRRRNAAKEG